MSWAHTYTDTHTPQEEVRASHAPQLIRLVPWDSRWIWDPSSPKRAGLWRWCEMFWDSGWTELNWGHNLEEGLIPPPDIPTCESQKRFDSFSSSLSRGAGERERHLSHVDPECEPGLRRPTSAACPLPLPHLDVLMYCCGLGHWRRVQSTYVSDHRGLTHSTTTTVEL